MTDASHVAVSCFQFVERFHRGSGELSIYVREQPAAFLVRASGTVGPALIRADLARARDFGRSHPEGWDYVADTTCVRFANPLNVIWLRRIRKLPNVSRYFVIAPSAAVRRAMRWTKWVMKPDRVVSSMSELECDSPARE